MKSILLHLCFILTACLFLTSCESTSNQDTKPETRWEIEPDLKSRKSALLLVGMTYEETIAALGKTTRIRKKKNKDGTKYQEWTYERFSRGTRGLTSMVKGSTRVNSVEQRALVKTTVSITFTPGGRIKTVKIRKRNETPSVFKPSPY